MYKALRLFLALCATVAPSLCSHSQTKAVSPTVNLPLTFEVNRGQTAPPVRYLARSREGVLFFTDQGVTLAVPQVGALRMILEDGSAAAIRGEGRLAARSNYLNPSGRSVINIENYSGVRYMSIYPGIDVKFYGHDNHLEHDFVLAQGADPNRIAIRLEGVDRARLLPDGRVLFTLGSITLSESKPVAWQEISGRKVEVAANWRLKGQNELGLALGAYNHDIPVTIDPVLAYSTHLGGSTEDDFSSGTTLPATTIIESIALDSARNVFVSGQTSAVDFPTTAGAFNRTPQQLSTFHDDTISESGFVSKFDSTGTVLLYSTFLHRDIKAMAVDSAGHAYTVENANDNFNGPNNDLDAGVFVDKLSADGSHLLYTFTFGASAVGSSCFTNGNSSPTGIAVDNSGHAWITGETGNPCMPTTPGVVESNIGPSDFCGFLARFDTNTSGTASVVYATYVGSSSQAIPQALAVDGSGNAYVTGLTGSGYPETATIGSGVGAFITKFNSTATARLYSTTFGDIGPGGNVRGIALDAGLNAYVAGSTTAPTFPTTAGAFDRTLTGSACAPPSTELCPDGFVSKFNPAGNALVYSTLLGGAGQDSINGIAVNNANMAFVTGFTTSSDFPTTASAFDKTVPAAGVAFVTALQPNGQSLYYSTILGGKSTTTATNATSIFVDPAWNAWVAGFTAQADFPVTSNAFQPGLKGNTDAFISKIVIAGDLKVTLGSNVASVAKNGNVILTGDLFDLGPDGSDAVVFTEAIPAGYKFQGISTNATSCTKPVAGATSGTVTCTQTRLESGTHFFVNVFVQAIGASGSNITSKATASARTQDLNTANNAASVTVHVN